MKYLLHKLVLTTIVIMTLFLVIVSSTVAWFNSNSTAELSQLNFQAEGSPNVRFSIDGGSTWVNQFDGDDIYKTISDYYDSINDHESSAYFYSLVANGSVANSVVNNDVKKKYGYIYQLVTPLATQNGFVPKFYNMEHSLENGNQVIKFHNLTSYTNPVIDGIDENNYNYYNPVNRYIKFTVKVKSDKDSYLYLKGTDVSVNSDAHNRDYASLSTIRLGFTSDYLTNEHCQIDHTHTIDCMHLKIYEPVNNFMEDLKYIPTGLNGYLHGDLISTFGVGYYYNKNYSDRFLSTFKNLGILKQHSILTSSHYELNTNYVNTTYGDGDTTDEQLYQLTYIKEALEKSKCKTFYEEDSTLLMEVNQTPQDFTFYIWCEGWDGCAGDFAGLGSFNISFSFIGIAK